MQCHEADELLSDLIDDELAEGARASVEAHVAGCAACTASLRQLRRTVRFVRTNADVELRPGTPAGLYMEFTRGIVDPGSTRDATTLARDEGYLGKGDER